MIILINNFMKSKNRLAGISVWCVSKSKNIVV